jgi:hypothetical protein
MIFRNLKNYYLKIFTETNMISLGDLQFRVPVMQGFVGKILPEAKRRRGDFFANPKGADLAGQ